MGRLCTEIKRGISKDTDASTSHLFILKVRCNYASFHLQVLLFPGLMASSAESGRSHIPNKEASSDTTQSLRDSECEKMQPATSKVLRRATLKIDLCFIPIVGMFCVPPLPLTSTSNLSAHLPFRSFFVLGECLGVAPMEFGGLNNSHIHGCRIDRTFLCSNVFIYLIRSKGISVMLR